MDSVLVVGGGIAGVSLADALRDSPVEVRLVERDELGSGTTRTSVASFAWHGMEDDLDHALAELSWETYRPLVEDGAIGYTPTGSMKVADSQAYLDELGRKAREFERRGVEIALLEPAEVAEHGIDPDAVGAGALHFPGVGRLDSIDATRALADRAAADGVEILTGVEVTGVGIEDGAVVGVVTTDGFLDADVVVNAAGPWAPELNDLAGVSVELRHNQGPLVEFPTDGGAIPTTTFENGHYFGWEPAATVLAGRHPRMATDEDEWKTAERLDPDTGPAVPDGFRAEALAMAPRALTATLGEPTGERTALRTLSPDGRPVVGETELAGFWMLGGMSGAGITYGPACGRLLADALLDETADERLAHVSLDRFAGGA